MRNDTSLTDLIGQIYDCSIDPGLWPETLGMICQTIDALAGSLYLHDLHQKRGSLAAEYGTDSEYSRSYGRHYAQQNPLIMAAAMCKLDDTVQITDIIDIEEYRESKLYREWAKPQSYGDVCGAILSKAPNKLGMFVAVRHDKKPEFSRGDLEQLSILSPHLRRAATIANLIEYKTVERNRFADIVDRLATAVFLLDAQGNVLHANKAAAERVATGVGAHMRENRLCLEQKSAERLLKEALDAKEGQAQTFPVWSRNDKPLVMTVMRLAAASPQLKPRKNHPAHAVFMHSPEVTARHPGEILFSLYGLTGGELRVLLALLEGLTAGEAAERFGISSSTVKTHLQRLFEKTGTSRQAELVSTVLGVLPPLRNA